MTTDDEALEALDRRVAALKQNATEADDLAVALCELEGGNAEQEGTIDRCEVFNWVWSQPRYDRAARAAILSGTR